MSAAAVPLPSGEPDRGQGTHPRSLGLKLAVFGLYAISGAAGLVYEVAWGRRLSLVLGATAVSSAVVLAAFLGALGVGAAFGGRLADRSRSPLRTYGLLELGAAAWAMLVPIVLPALEWAYVHVAAGTGAGPRIPLAFLTALIAVGPAAALLGATFPCVLRALAGNPAAVGPTASLLYGVNTVGAVAGALWAGFSAIASIGVTATSRVAALVAAVVGVLALALARRPLNVSTPPAEDPRIDGPAAPRLALAAAAVSGLVALGLEAAGFRILVFFVEGFTVSFAAMLGVFLAGLALGSLLLGPILARRIPAPAAFGGLLLAAGIATLVLGASISQFEGVLRDVRETASKAGDPMVALQRTALVGSLLLFFAPALLLGAAYPLSIRWAAGTGVEGLGRRVGAVALWNALGAVAGPLLVLVIGLTSGARRTPGGPLLAWTVLGLVAVAVGLAAIVRSLALPRRAVPIVGVLLGLGFGFGTPVLVARATPEALVLASRVVRDSRGDVDVRRLLVDVRADETTTASVIELPTSERILNTDAFAAAATGPNYPYMRMLGHLPAVLAMDPRRALVIAFGTGTTAGALASTASFERIEIVEASRAVYALAPRFDAVHRNVLEDARVVHRVDDGRHALLLHAPDLDVITLEPLMPYTPAALPFYTREFYELARDRLREGGVVCQWVPIHAMRPDVYAALLRTFFETFPDGSLWFFEQSTVLFGRKGVATPTLDMLAKRVEELKRGLYLAGIRRPTSIGAAYIATGRRVLEVLDDPSRSSQEALRTSSLGLLTGRIVTDDDPFPEAYPAPRAGIATSYAADTLAWLLGVLAPSEEASKNPIAGPDGLDGAPRFREVVEASLSARAAEANGDFRLTIARDAEGRAGARARFEAAVVQYEFATQRNEGGDLTVDIRRIRLSRRLLTLSARDRLADADRARQSGDVSAEHAAIEAALALARRAYEVEPYEAVATERPQAMALWAEILARAGRCSEALDLLVTPRVNWGRDASLSDVGSWLSARLAGRDPASVPFISRSLIERLAHAAPCVGAASGRVGAQIRALERHLDEGKAIPFRATAELLLASFPGNADATDEIARRLRAHTDPLAPDVESERAALLRILAPADDRLTSMLADAEVARRVAALRTAAHFGFERLHVLAEVRALFARSSDAAHRVEFAEAALGDPSPEIRGLMVELLVDPDALVRRTAWRSLSGSLSSAAKGAVGYDPDAPDADRAAAVERLKRQ